MTDIGMRALALAMVATALSAGAGVEPAAVFSDHAVLRRSADTPVFGFADAGTRVSVSLSGVSASGVADAEGRWLVRLDLRKVGQGPFELAVNDWVAQDVLVGETWLCSGQSNMEFAVGSGDDAEEENRVTNALIRCFHVQHGVAVKPRERIRGAWLRNIPGETLRMTSVGYHFAKDLQRALGVPVGIVDSSYGASTLEAWCDPKTFVHPDGRRIFDRQVAFMERYRDYENRCEAALRAWAERFGRADRPHGGAPAEGWRPLSEAGRTAFSHAPGAVWFRRTMSVKPGAGLAIRRHRFIESQWGFDSSAVEIYWNGRRIGRTFPDDPIEKNVECYDIPAEPSGGKGVLDVRAFNPVSFLDIPRSLFVDGVRPDRDGWTVADEFVLPAVPAEARAALPAPQRFCLPQHYPSGLHNAMIAGLIPFGFSGVVWYQGESNTVESEAATDPDAYAELFRGFIASWRTLFGNPELPFAWCQLAAYMGKSKDANGRVSPWVRVRAAQQCALELPMTGQAVLIDAGESEDIHPRDKRTPGKRLAAWALNRVYGRNAPYRGPHVAEAVAEGGAVTVAFADAAGGLIARDLGRTYVRRSRTNAVGTVERNSPDAEVEGFSLCGADGVWHWADRAEIGGTRVRVSAKAVPEPVAVRYGWAVNPWVNLYNADGFPAEPFEWRLDRNATKGKR